MGEAIRKPLMPVRDGIDFAQARCGAPVSSDVTELPHTECGGSPGDEYVLVKCNWDRSNPPACFSHRQQFYYSDLERVTVLATRG
jgi:hypothetical protein